MVAIFILITIARSFNIYNNAALEEGPAPMYHEIDITDILTEVADDWMVNLESELVELYINN